MLWMMVNGVLVNLAAYKSFRVADTSGTYRGPSYAIIADGEVPIGKGEMGYAEAHGWLDKITKVLMHEGVLHEA